jgi:hypothetical protein
MSGPAPSDLPEWATDAGATVEPLAGKKASGYVFREKPPAKESNWLLNLIYQWLFYFGTKNAAGGVAGIDDTDGSFKYTNAVTNKPGCELTGNGTAAGGKFTGGASAGAGVEAVAGAGGLAVKATGVIEASAGLKALAGAVAGSTTIDGYKTGTFTPEVGTDATSNVTHSTQTGTYARIGKLVICTFKIVGNTGVGSTGQLFVTGFPYKTNIADSLSGQARFTGTGPLVAGFQNTIQLQGSSSGVGCFMFPSVPAGTAPSATIGTAFNANTAFTLLGTLIFVTDDAF